MFNSRFNSKPQVRVTNTAVTAGGGAHPPTVMPRRVSRARCTMHCAVSVFGKVRRGPSKVARHPPGNPPQNASLMVASKSHTFRIKSRPCINPNHKTPPHAIIYCTHLLHTIIRHTSCASRSHTTLYCIYSVEVVFTSKHFVNASRSTA